MKTFCYIVKKQFYVKSLNEVLFNWRSLSQSFHLGIESLWDPWLDFGGGQDKRFFILRGAFSVSRGRVYHVIVHSSYLYQAIWYVRGCIQKFPDWVIKKYMLTFGITRWQATQKFMATKVTILNHKIAIQLRRVAESCTICCSRFRRSVPETFGYNLVCRT
jgi:hypothetical protein